MNEALHFLWGEQVPQSEELIAITEDVFWLRMSLPFALDHINLWFIKTPTGSFIIDCGIANDKTRNAWQSLFHQHPQLMPVEKIIATHCHPDHVGLAGWLCAQWQAPLLMSATEYSFARMLQNNFAGFDGEALQAHFARHGLVDKEAIQQLRTRDHYYSSLTSPLPTSYVRLQDGDQITIGKHRWQLIDGYGHSPEHISLYCAEQNILIAGDMVLPRISTNVSVFAIEPEGNPLALYLRSLERLKQLPEDVLVLPAHGKPFKGLHTRIAQLIAHHEMRLSELKAACAIPRNAMDLLPILFKRTLDNHQLVFALGEAIAHLNYLWHADVLERLCENDSLRFVFRKK